MPGKLTTREYIARAREKHGGKYDYPRTVYTGANVKVTVTCREHGDFLVPPLHHSSSGTGCKRCSGTHRYTTEEYITEVRKKHDDTYDYPRTVYTNAHGTVTVTCREHGDFELKAYSHLQGIGCKKCSGNYSPTTEEYIAQAREKHGDKYDYSKTLYTAVNEPVTIICPEHGEFKQLPSYHVGGGHCKKCSGNYSPTTEEYIAQAREEHGDEYDYSKTVYIRGHDKVIIICREHGDFEQEAKVHTEGRGCQECYKEKGRPLRLTNDDVLARSREKHGDKYDYSKVDYTGVHDNITIMLTVHPNY